MSFYVSTATFFLLHCDEWDRVVALPRHKFVTGATLLQLSYYVTQDTSKKMLKPQKQILLYLSSILLTRSYAPEPNPGPRAPKHPYGQCSKAVTWQTAGIGCDQCDTWYHKDCLGISTQIYQGLHNVSWYYDIWGYGFVKVGGHGGNAVYR